MSDLLVAITPSRGLIHSRVAEAVWRELKGIEGWRLVPCDGPSVVCDGPSVVEVKTNWLLSHDLPSPYGLNGLVTKALDSGAKWIWSVEEDTVPPIDCLKKLLYSETPISAIPYRLRGGSPSAGDFWASLGCTLIRSEVFRELGSPWFRTNIEWHYQSGEWRPRKSQDHNASYDADFYLRARDKGIQFSVLGMFADHLNVNRTNFSQPSCHEISSL